MGVSTMILDHQPAIVRRPQPFIALTLLLCLVGVWGVLASCSGDTTNPVSVPAQQAYWALQLDQHALALALTPPYDTVHLSALALSAVGTPLAGAGSVHYSDLDSSVTLDATGLVTARYRTASTRVVASLTVHGVTLTDTAIIQVTDSALHYPLASFSIQPRADGLDSARFAVDGQYYYTSPVVPVYATNTHGDTLCNVNGCALVVAFTSSDPTVASIDHAGNVTPHIVGRVTFTATTWAYGVAKKDSLPFVITYPSHAFVVINALTPVGSQTPVLWISPAADTVGVGADVNFSNFASTDTVDVEFDDSTTVVGGNIPILAFMSGGHCCADRFFSTIGTHTYRSHKLGITGAVVVSDGP